MGTTKPTLLFLENHDSFSYLLADALARLGAKCVFIDTYATYCSINFADYKGVVIGPGPGTERTSPNLMAYVADVVNAGLPVLGVCLGMQAVGVHFGAELNLAQVPVHGKVRQLVPTEGSILFPDGPEVVVRYHSLVLKNLPVILKPEAYSPENECMALRHKELPIWGVQYHPEAACTPAGLAFLHRWLQFAGLAPLGLPLSLAKAPVPMQGAPVLALS